MANAFDQFDAATASNPFDQFDAATVQAPQAPQTGSVWDQAAQYAPDTLGAQGEAQAMRQLDQNPYWNQLGKNMQEFVPHSVEQAAEMFVPGISSFKQDLQIPQEYRDMGTPPGYGAQHHTFDQFTPEDWQRFNADMTAQGAGAAMAIAPFLHGVPADAAVRESMLNQDAINEHNAAREIVPASEQPNRYEPLPVEPPPITRVSPETGEQFVIDPKTGETIQPPQPAGTNLKPNEFQTSEAEAGQRDTAPTVPSTVEQPGEPGTVQEGGQGYSGRTAPETAGTSNRQNIETYGEGAVPSGQGVDTGELLDNARASIRSGDTDPYSVLSKTQQRGIATPEEYATLAAEHERLVNDAVAKEKAGDPTAPQAAQAAEDFANAIQPHKTAASDLMRLFQGDLDYDLSTPFGMDQYMKAEIGRGMKPSEQPAFTRRAQDISQAQADVQQAVARSDARVQSRYAKVRDIPIEEAAARVREQLNPCLV